MRNPEKKTFEFAVYDLEAIRNNILYGEEPEPTVIDRENLAETLRQGGFSETVVEIVDTLLLWEAERKEDVEKCFRWMTRRDRKYTIWEALYEVSSYFPKIRLEDAMEVVSMLTAHNRLKGGDN